MDFIIIAIAVFEIALGVIVFLRGEKTKGNRAFVGITFCLSFWCITIYMLWHSSQRYLLFWDNATYLGSSLLAAIFLYFSLQFPHERRISVLKKIFIFMPVPLIWFLAFASFITPTISSPLEKGYGVGYYIFAGYFLVFMISGFIILCYTMRHSKSLDKTRMQYVFYGAMLSTAVGAFCNLIMPIFGIWNFIKLGPPISGVVLVSSFSYAILKYKLFDIEVIVKKTLVFTGLFAIVYGVFVGITVLTQELFAGGRLLGLAISSLILIFTVRPLEGFLTNITNKYLFQKKYNPSELIRTFSKSVLTVLDLDKIAELTVDKLTKVLNLTNCAILIPSKEGDKFIIKKSCGIEDQDIAYKTNSELIKYLDKVNNVLLGADRNPAAKAAIKDMDLIKGSISLPIKMRGQLIGVLCLGNQKSDRDYTKDDIETLLLLADALGVAITNALNFEEARQKEKLATIGTMASGIKHDISTPINKMSTAVQKFLIEGSEGDYKSLPREEVMSNVYDLLSRCQMTFEKVVSISAKFADYTKPQKKAIMDIINLESSIETALSILDHEIQAKKITVRKDVEKDLPSIKGDKDYMEQILFNVIRNALQAMQGTGKIGDEAVIKITAKKGIDKNVYIEISDSGVGIPEDGLDKIFEAYYSTKKEGRGTGLGLAIVKELVERSGGQISANSEMGKGTTFILEFPAE